MPVAGHCHTRREDGEEQIIMSDCATQVSTLARDERGATATEYGLLAAFVALIIVAGVTVFGENLNTYYGDLATWIGTVI